MGNRKWKKKLTAWFMVGAMLMGSVPVQAQEAAFLSDGTAGDVFTDTEGLPFSSGESGKTFGADSEAADGTELFTAGESADGPGEEVFTAEGETGSETGQREIWFENLRDPENDTTWLFSNENYEIRLGTLEELSPESTVGWSVGIRKEGDVVVEDVPVEAYTVAEDRKGVTLHGEVLSGLVGENQWLELLAVVSDGERELEYTMGFGVREPVYDYHYPLSSPGEDSCLPGQTRYIDQQMGCYYEDENQPYGGEAAVAVTGLSLVRQDVYSDELQDWTEAEPGYTVLNVIPQEGGWNLEAVDYGRAILNMEYETIGGEKAEREFEVYVNGDVYTLEYRYKNESGQNQLRPNEELQITTSLRREWNYGDDQGGEWLEHYTLTIDGDENGPFYDTNLIDVKVEDDQKSLLITAKGQQGGTVIPVRATIERSDGENTWTEETYQEIYVEVLEGWHYLLPVELQNESGQQKINPAVGETLDLNGFDPQVWEVTADNQAVVSDVRFRLEYDTNCWSKEGSSEDIYELGQIPVLTRTGDWGTNVALIALREEGEQGGGNWQEVCRRDYWFDGLDYSVWFENLRDPENDTTWVYSDEDYEVSLNTENIGDKAYTTEWSVGIFTEGDEEPVPVSSDAFTVKEDGNSVILHGAKLSSITLEENQWLDLQVKILAGGQVVWEHGMGFGVKDPRQEYDYPLDGPEENVFLPGQVKYIENQMHCYYENSDKPYGEETTVAVIGLSVACQEIFDDEVQDWVEVGHTILEVIPQDGGWGLEAVDYGRAILSMEYETIGGKKVEWEIEVYVNGDAYTLEYRYENESGQNQLRPNEELQVTTSLRREWNYGDDQGEEWLEDYTLSIEGDGNGPFYDTNLIQAEIIGEDQKSLLITAKGQQGGTVIPVCATIERSDGGKYWREKAYQEIYVEVQEGWHYLQPAELQNESGQNINPAVGEALDLNGFDPEVWEVTADNREVVTDVRFRLEYDTNCWSTEGSSEEIYELGQIPVLTRTGDWGTGVALIALREDGEPGGGNWQEVCRRDYWFDGLDYSVWFENLRGDWYFWEADQKDYPFTWIYETESEFTLSLNTSGPDRIPGCSVQTEAGILEAAADGSSTFTPLEQGVVIDGTNVTLDGTILAEKQKELNENQLLAVRNIVTKTIAGQEKTVWEENTVLFVRNAEWITTGMGSEITAMPGEGWDLRKDENGTIFAELWVENQERPYGEMVEVSVSEITIEDETIVKRFEDSDGIYLRGFQAGTTNVILKFKNEELWPGEEKELSIPFTVEMEKYRLHLYLEKPESGQETYAMLPNEERQLQAELLYFKVEGEPEETENGIEAERVTEKLDAVFTYDDYDENLISVTADGKITAKGRYGTTGVRVRAEAAARPDLDVFEEYLEVSVADSYEVFETETITAEAGKEIILNPVLKNITWKDQEGTPVPEAVFSVLEYDANYLEQTGEMTFRALPVKGEQTTEVLLLCQRDDFYWTGSTTITIPCTHSWQEERKEPTCTQNGYFKNVCRHCKAVEENSENILPARGHSMEVVVTKTADCGRAGSQYRRCKNCTYKESPVSIPATGRHSFGSYVVTKKATALEPGTETRTCSVCQKSESRALDKLKPTMELNAKSIVLKVKQSTTAFRVSGMAEGDFVKSIVSDNKKLVKVSSVKGSGTCKLTARKKTGTAKLTITLASGLKKTIKVKVQKNAVKTTSITNVQKRLTLSKGKKFSLAPILQPITSEEKITYTSSNKKVATVSSKGIIKGKKRGKAKITIKAGKKKYTCTVTVR